jgi:hypothetical protein
MLVILEDPVRNDSQILFIPGPEDRFLNTDLPLPQ